MSHSLKGFKKIKQKEFLMNFSQKFINFTKKFYYIGGIILLGCFMVSPLPYSIWYYNQEDIKTVLFFIFSIVLFFLLIGTLLYIVDYTTSENKTILFMKLVMRNLTIFILSTTILFYIGQYTFPFIFLTESEKNINKKLKENNEDTYTYVYVLNNLELLMMEEGDVFEGKGYKIEKTDRETIISIK